MRRLHLTLPALAALCAPALAADEPIGFRKQVAPILVAKCLGCHDDQEAKSGLNLATFAKLKRGGKGEGEAILAPGDPENSGLIATIRPDASPRMPYKQPPLSDAEIATLERWVKQGAKFDGPSEETTTLASLVDPLQGLPKVAVKVATSDPIAAVAFAPDGKTVAAALGRKVLLFDADSGQLAYTLAGHPGPVNALRITPDGKTLIACGGRPGMFGALTFWDLDRKVRRAELRGHADAILGIALAPDGKTLASASYDRLVKLWDVANAAELRTLKEHTDAVYAVAFSPDGASLATAAADRTAKVWELATGHRRVTLSDATAELYAVAFAPDGKTVLAAGVDRSIRAWEVSGANATLVRSAFAHDGPVLRLVASPDGTTLYSGGEDKAVKVWNLADLKPLAALPAQPDWPLAIAADPRKPRLAVGRYDGSLTLLDAKTGAVALALLGPLGAPVGKPELTRNATLNPPSPRVAVRGSKVRVTLTGTGVGLATEVFVGSPKVVAEIVSAEKPDPNRLEVDLDIAADAPPGGVGLSVLSPLGRSPGQAFLITAEPDAAEAEPNDALAQAKAAGLPSTITGVIEKPGDVDHFRFDAKAGQALVFLPRDKPAGSTWAGALALLDPQGKVLAEAIGLDGDPTLTHVAQADGPVILRVSDALLGGSGGHAYRISAGLTPHLETALPLGIQRGTSVDVAVKGLNLGGSEAVKVSAPIDAAPGSTVSVPVGAPSGPMLVVADGPQAVEAEENDSPGSANAVATPGGISGRIDRPGDADHFRFSAKKGQRLIVEVYGRRLRSPIDPVIEVLDSQGRPIPRAVLRPVAETAVAFRDHGSLARAMRLTKWDDFAIGDHLLIGRELTRLFEMPKNPDDDAVLWGVGGERIGFLETTPEQHPMNQAIYKVEIHPPGSTFPPGGVPPVVVNHCNDDGGPGFAKDARVTLDPPADGDYLVRVEDVRGLGGEGFAYHLVVREPHPGFVASLSADNPNVPRGGTTLLTASVNRIDGFDEPVDFAIEGLPPGISAPPVRVERGANSADFTLLADETAPATSPPTWRAVATAAGTDGQVIRQEIDPGGPGGGWISVGPAPNLKIRAEPGRIELRAGGRVEAKFLVERGPAFAGRVPIEVKNLPRGVRVLNLGLNGVLVTEAQAERSVTLYAEPWAEPAERPIFAVGKAEAAGTDHSSPPITLVIQPSSSPAAPTPATADAARP